MRGVTAPLTDADAARLFAPLASVNRIVLAVSGGPDSTAMMGLFAAWRAQAAAPQACVVSVDHGLRPESAAEARGVVEAARGLGLDGAVLVWAGAKPSTGVQAAARQARYRLIADHATAYGAEAVVLAHTSDDQAETVLMRLLHGSGLNGLQGMQTRSRRGALVLFRPFLGVSKAQLEATCAARGWEFVRDPSNRNDRFLRPRLRRLLPQLAAEGLTPERLCRLAERAFHANQALDGLAHRARLASRQALAGRTVPAGTLDAGAMLTGGRDLAVRLLEAAIRDCLSVAADEAQRALRLDKLEAMADRLLVAHGAQTRFAGTIAGVKVVLAQGLVQFSLAPPRRSR